MTNDLSSAERSLDRGDAEKALVRAEAALDGRPDWPRAHMLAASAASRLGRYEEASRHLTACRETLELLSDSLDAHLNIAALYVDIEDFETALELLEPLPKKFGDNPELLDLLSLSLHQVERFQDALVIYKKLLKQEPGNLNIHHNICAALLADGDARQAASFSNKWLKHAPGDTEALSVRAIALEESGAAVAAHKLMDFDRFVVSEIIEVPEGYGSLETFNKSLEIVILSHPGLDAPPDDVPHLDIPALRMTRQVLGPDIGPIADIEKLIRTHVKAYYSQINRPKTHPFIAAQPDDYALSVSAVVMVKEGGLGSHIHEDGHLTGYYFIRATAGFVAGESGSAGSLDIGRPPPEFGCTKQHRHKSIKPEDGMILLFPSYMHHEMEPFEIYERLICLPFYVSPK